MRGVSKWETTKDFPIEYSTVEVGIYSGLFSGPQTYCSNFSSLVALFLADFFFLASLLVSEVVLTPPQNKFVNIGPYHILCKQIQIKPLTKQLEHNFGEFMTSVGE